MRLRLELQLQLLRLERTNSMRGQDVDLEQLDGTA
jgi:hypothetical protein